jgi:hypothetical protein
VSEWTSSQQEEFIRARMRKAAELINPGDGLPAIQVRTSQQPGCPGGSLHGAQTVRLRKGGWFRCVACGHRVKTGRRKLYQTRTRPWVAPFEIAGRVRARHPGWW